MTPAGKAGLLRATLTLLAGGAAAQAVPLLLGPLIARLYGPQEFGHFSLFSALAANLGVIACARYEFALPLARDAEEARDLMALCARVLAAVVLFAAILSLALGLGGWLRHWVWLAPAVLAAGLAQWLTMWATREERFQALSAARVLQYGGAAGLQVAAGWVAPVAPSLIAGPMLAGVASAGLLASSAKPFGGWRSLWAVRRDALLRVAKKHRDFPLLNTPHAFLGALSDSVTLLLIAAWAGDAAVGFWGLTLRYLKAPATLVGSAVSQALYPKLTTAQSPALARQALRQVMLALSVMAVVLMLVLMAVGPALFAYLFGEPWRVTGELARALSPYIAVHFVAAPLAVVTMAWGAQAWALRLAVAGQVMFLLALGLGLFWGGLIAAAWSVSAAMVLYFGFYFWSLLRWKEIPTHA